MRMATIGRRYDTTAAAPVYYLESHGIDGGEAV